MLVKIVNGLPLASGLPSVAVTSLFGNLRKAAITASSVEGRSGLTPVYGT